MGTSMVSPETTQFEMLCSVRCRIGAFAKEDQQIITMIISESAGSLSLVLFLLRNMS